MEKASNTILDGSIIIQLQNALSDIFFVSEWTAPRDAPQGTIVFHGQLLYQDSEQAYDLIAERWHRLDYTPLLQHQKGKHALIAHPGVIKPKPSNPWINLVLFVVTLISVLAIAALSEGAEFWLRPQEILWGLPFAISFMLILGAHELGHYFLARYHNVAVTLPYFIPFPTLWGTLGAFIQLRSPTLTRKQLFDVGVAGPLAGLIVAVPVLFVGLFLSEIQPLPSNGEPYIMEGNSIFYWLSKFLVFGQAFPSADGYDVFLHPLAWAGWSGLALTMFNLLPAGQLDGGHVAYVLFGRHARFISLGVVALMILLIPFWIGWVVWALLIFFLTGVDHPPPLNDVAPIGPGRKFLGYFMILVFLLLFSPVPIQFVGT